MELRTSQSLKKLKIITRELAEDIRDECIGGDSLFDAITTILDFLPVLCEIVTPDHKIIYINDYTRKHIKKLGGPNVKLGETCYATIWGRDEPCGHCPLESALKSGMVEAQEWTPPKHPDHHYAGKLITIPLKWDGTSAVLIVGKSEDELEKEGMKDEWNR